MLPFEQTGGQESPSDTRLSALRYSGTLDWGCFNHRNTETYGYTLMWALPPPLCSPFSLPLCISLPKALSNLHPLQMAFRHFLECTPIKEGSLFTDVSHTLTTVPDSQKLLRTSVCFFMNQGMNWWDGVPQLNSLPVSCPLTYKLNPIITFSTPVPPVYEEGMPPV